VETDHKQHTVFRAGSGCTETTYTLIHVGFSSTRSNSQLALSFALFYPKRFTKSTFVEGDSNISLWYIR